MSDYPYPGLRPFQRSETDIFFGREEHTDQLKNWDIPILLLWLDHLVVVNLH
jgi:hypothetical protein